MVEGSFSRLLSGVEIAFVYQIPLAARRALDAHPDRRSTDEWRLHRLFPPFSTTLVGQDRVGVLLCSSRFGELWLGFDTDVSAGLALETNATQLQVAAGVLAGWAQLGSRVGIHFVEKLDWQGFLGGSRRGARTHRNGARSDGHSAHAGRSREGEPVCQS